MAVHFIGADADFDVRQHAVPVHWQKCKLATFLAVPRAGLVLIPTVLLMSWLMGLNGLEMSQSTSEIISALTTIPFLIVFFRTLPANAGCSTGEPVNFLREVFFVSEK